MRKELYEWDNRSLDEKVRIPKEWFFESDDDEREQAKAEAREMVRGEDVVILGDADADGLSATAAIRDYYGEDVTFIPCGPHGSSMFLGDALWVCADDLDEGATVIIHDIAVDQQWKMKALPNAAERAGEILWFDHHEWSDDCIEFAEEHTDYFEVDDGEDDEDAGVYDARCAAMMVRDYYEQQGHEYDDKFSEAMDVTGEYDLWRLRDERCYDLNDLTHAVDDHDEYISLVQKHGADVLDDDSAASRVAEYREEQQELEDAAVENAEQHQIGDWTVATVYGNCSANDVAERLRQDGFADVVVFTKPHGGLSLRGSDDFQKCHLIAEQFDGGGHAQAAGARTSDLIGDSLLDYSEHWQTNGEKVLSVVLDEFRNLSESESDAPEATAD